MTVYRRFGIQGDAARRARGARGRRCLRPIAAALDPDARRSTSGSTDLFVADAEGDPRAPLLERLARVEPEALLRELTRDDSAVFRLVREFLIG